MSREGSAASADLCINLEKIQDYNEQMLAEFACRDAAINSALGASARSAIHVDKPAARHSNHFDAKTI